MKASKYLLLFFLVTSFISCEKNENVTQKFNQDLLGTWNLTELFTENGSIKITIDNVTKNGSFSMSGKDFSNATLTFSENPNNITNSGSFTRTITVTIDGKTNTEEEVAQSTGVTTGTTSWSIDNNTLTITDDEVSIPFEIVTLTANSLRIRADFSDSNLFSDDYQITGNLILVMSK